MRTEATDAFERGQALARECQEREVVALSVDDIAHLNDLARELEAMRVIVAALVPLDNETRDRVINWLCSRWSK